MRNQAFMTLGLLLATACNPSVDKPDAGYLRYFDASVAPPTKPIVQTPAPLMPYTIATFRGTAQGAQRIFVESPGANTIV